MTCTRKITPAQGKALTWLRDHGGDATWVKGGATILAQGEVAPFERKTWVALRDAQRIEFKDGRVRALDDAVGVDRACRHALTGTLHKL